jgi:hypothetical protein
MVHDMSASEKTDDKLYALLTAMIGAMLVDRVLTSVPRFSHEERIGSALY